MQPARAGALYRLLGTLSALLFLSAVALGLFQALRQRQAPPPVTISPQQLIGDMLVRGDYAQAVVELEAALRMGPERHDRAELLADLGRSLAEVGRTEEAAQRFAEALEAGLDRADLRLLRIRVLAELGRYAEAADEYRAILRRTPDDAEMVNNLGYTLERNGDREAALAEYERAVALDGSLVQAHFNLGRLRLAAGDAEGALPSLERAVALRPELADAHAALGDACLALGRRDDAAERYARALASDRHRADVRRKRGELLLRMGRTGEAAGELRLAALQSPDDAVLLNNVAWLLATHPDPQVRSPRDALLLAQRLVALDPASSSFDTLAAAYASAGDFEGAVATAEKALERAREHGDAALVFSIDERRAAYAAGRQTFDTRWTGGTP